MNRVDAVAYEAWSSELTSALALKHQYLENARNEKDEGLKSIYEDVAKYHDMNADSLMVKINILKKRQ